MCTEHPQAVQGADVAPWPQIEGIDGQAACGRLGGDVALFTSMLQRLLREFSGLERCSVLTEPDQRACASRLHKLKGTAGTLGATGLARLAAQAEHQARTGQFDALGVSLAALSAKLAELGEQARPVLTLAQDRDMQRLKLTAPPRLDLPALEKLLAQLRDSNMAAEKQFRALAPALLERLGPQAFDELRLQIDELQYDLAAAALALLARSSAEVESPG
jgi:HPt (histidine-containing phosphotransfer) domain-containing protein